MCSFEELIANGTDESAAVRLILLLHWVAHRIGPHDAKVSQAWNTRATMPVQYSKMLLTVTWYTIS